MNSPETTEVFKRAIVYFAWGEKFILQATASARSAKFMGVKTVLITNGESAGLVIAKDVFDKVTVVDLQYGNKMDKCMLWSHLPEDCDSFALLDTDTIVINDISFGFEKAERHGIAIAPAPNYNLGHHWGFRAAMPAMGLADRSQLQMNTGVVFFVRRTDVERVFLKWKALAIQFGDNDDVSSDQPLFTAAMELLNFNPYTMSQSYNYRGLGELAAGHVHLWHSHYPVPEDLNKDVKDWPPRRFVDGKRVPYSNSSLQLKLAGCLRRLFRVERNPAREDGSTASP